MRVFIDAGVCQGHGLSGCSAPLLFESDGTGFGFLRSPRPLEPEQATLAQWAVAGCPERAITIEDD